MIQFIKKHPWAFGGAIFGIVGGLVFGIVIRNALDFDVSTETNISIILLIAYTVIGTLYWSILGAIYRTVQSKQLLRKYRWWAIAGAVYGGFSGMFGGIVMGWGIGQLVANTFGEPNTGIIVSFTIAGIWGIITASLSTFVGAIMGTVIGAIVAKRILYVAWLILSLYVSIQYSDNVNGLWEGVAPSSTTFIFTFLLVTGLGWVVIKKFELQLAFELSIQKLFDKLQNVI